MSKKIKLTQNRYTEVSKEDFEYLSQWKWCAALLSGRYYAVRSTKSNESCKRHQVLMHIVILERKLGRSIKQDLCVDHRNGNGLDNRRENLREVTYSLNGFNRKSQHNKSGHRGVYLIDNNRYKVSIKYKGILRHIGHYDTLEEAIEARKIANIIFFGE